MQNRVYMSISRSDETKMPVREYFSSILLTGMLTMVQLAAADVRDSFGSHSLFDAATGVLEKLNSPGVTIWRSDPVPVEAGRPYRGELEYEVLSCVPGSLCSVSLVSLNEDRRVIGSRQESGVLHQVIFDRGPRRIERFIPESHGAKFMRFELKLAGNPGKVKIGSMTVEAGGKGPLFQGQYTPKEPAPDREKGLLAMAELPPAEAWIEQQNNRPCLMLDGKPVAGKAYKGSRDYGPFARSGANLMITFNSGTTLFWDKCNWDLATMRTDGSFDFSRLEQELLFIHHTAPEAKVLVTVNCDVGEDFFRKHPDSIFRDEAGRLGVRQLCAFAGFDVPGPNPAKNRHWTVSYSSEEYRKYVCDGLRQLAEFLKNSPAGNIVAGFTLNGGHDDQFLQWEYSGARGQMDYSPAACRAFRSYLREKYRTTEALRAAWLEPTVTLDTAEPFSEKEWQSRSCWNTAVPGLDRKVSDGREFISLSIARLQNAFGRILRETFGRRCVVATYYSTPIWRQVGRQHLSELVKDGNIGVLFQVSGYSALRRIGGMGASANFAIAAAHMRNAVYFQELDHRTWRSQITPGWDEHQAAEAESPTVFRMQMLRDCGAVLAYGGDGFFYFDMFDSWYNDPEALAVVAETYRMADWQNRYRDQVPRSDAAVFLDEKERFYAEQRGGEELYYIWRLSGLTPDVCFLDDLTNPQLPEYKLYLVPSPATLSRGQLKALKRILATPGKVVVLTGNCGTSSLGKTGCSAPALEELGLQVEDHLTSLEDTIAFAAPEQDMLLAGCVGKTGLTDLFLGDGNRMVCTPLRHWTSVTDPAATVLGA